MSIDAWVILAALAVWIGVIYRKIQSEIQNEELDQLRERMKAQEAQIAQQEEGMRQFEMESAKQRAALQQAKAIRLFEMENAKQKADLQKELETRKHTPTPETPQPARSSQLSGLREQLRSQARNKSNKPRPHVPIPESLLRATRGPNHPRYHEKVADLAVEVYTPQRSETVERIATPPPASTDSDETRDSQLTKNSICKKCAKLKPKSEFYFSKKRQGELTKWCKGCLARLDERNKLGHYKTCPRCKKRRRIYSFSDNHNTKDGLSKWCKMCHKKLKGARIYR